VVNEYRLNLAKAFNLHQPVTADQYARIVAAMNEKNPRVAADMVDMIAPGKSVVEWLSGYARQFPDQPAAANGAHLFQMLKAHSGEPAAVLQRAGFDAIDTGAGDVRKLTGQGIRSKDAVFDPAPRARR